MIVENIKGEVVPMPKHSTIKTHKMDMKPRKEKHTA
jgi:hypothetical protein